MFRPPRLKPQDPESSFTKKIQRTVRSYVNDGKCKVFVDDNLVPKRWGRLILFVGIRKYGDFTKRSLRLSV